LVQWVVLAVLALAVVGDALYVARVGRPGQYPDRRIGWFMTSIGVGSISEHAVLAAFAAGLLTGELAGWAYALAGLIGVGAIWFRVWMSWRAAPRMRRQGGGRPMGAFLRDLAPYTKAIRGAATAGLGALLVALASPGINATEWVLIVLAVIGAGEAVHSSSNAPQKPPAPAESDPADTAGAAVYETGRAPE
jgi:hypothetical protein